jgi:urocanate hydratase
MLVPPFEICPKSEKTFTMTSAPAAARTVCAQGGTQLSCKGWQQEAALCMLMNNLGPDVPEQRGPRR